MHSFHQSRGRILFEVLCALGMSASLVGAWQQTDATALLPAAGLSLVWALVRMSDMSGRKPTENRVQPKQALPVENEPQPVEQAPLLEMVDEAEPAVKAAAKPKASRSKAPRKNAARRAKAPEEAPVVEPAKLEELVIAETPAPEEAAEESPPIPLEPLFEPQPFVRQQHAVFGRKARFG